MRRFASLLAVLASLALLAPSGAAAGEAPVVLYAASKGIASSGVDGVSFGDATLYTVDPATGVATQVGAILDGAVPVRNVSGLVVLPDGRLLAAAGEDAVATAPAGVSLYEIDPATAEATLVGVVGTDGNAGECARVTDLGYASATGTLYGYGDYCDSDFANEVLVVIDPSTGAATPVATTGVSFSPGNAFAVEPATGTLYLLSAFVGPQALATVDPATAVVTPVAGSENAFGDRHNAMAFHPGTGLGYTVFFDATGTGNSMLTTFDPANASAGPSVVGTLRDGADTPIVGFDALAFSGEGGAVVVNCPAAPLPSCDRPIQLEASSLTLKPKDTDPSKNKLSWAWKKGPALGVADFGDPTLGTSYALCLWDETASTPSLVVSAAVPGGSSWKANKKGFTYKSKAATPDGIKSVKLKAGDAGKSKVQVKGKGVSLPTLPLSQDAAVTAQLVGAGGQCFGAVFPQPAKKNDVKKFQAKGE